MDAPKVRIYRDVQSDRVLIFISRRGDGEGRDYLQPDGHWEYRHESEVGLPFASLSDDYDMLQKLADALHEFGVTPHGCIPQRGEIEATERHLGDMRAIVGKLMKIEHWAAPQVVMKEARHPW